MMEHGQLEELLARKYGQQKIDSTCWRGFKATLSMSGLKPF